MHRLYSLILIVLTCSVNVLAQESPRGEVFGGFSFAHQGELNMPGWNGSFVVHLNDWFGLVADASGHYASEQEVFITSPTTNLIATGNLSTLAYRFGPRFTSRASNRIAPFVQALFGGTHVVVKGSIPFGFRNAGLSITESYDGFAAAFGAGMDVTISDHIAIRAIQIDYSMLRFAGDVSNGVRASTGFVIKF